MPEVHVVHPGDLLQCTTYLLAGQGGSALVDPGSGIAEERVLEGIRRAGADPADIRYVLLTHCHVDHARGAYRFRERGAKLVASPRTAEILRAGGHQVWYEYPEEVIPTEVDLTPGDAALLDLCGLEVQVVHTPGHTDGCVSYLVATDEGLAAFTGDLITGMGHPGWAGSEGFSVAATLASIDKLIALAPRRAFWGHGPIDEPPTVWLNRARALGRAGRWQLDAEPHPQHRLRRT